MTTRHLLNVVGCDPSLRNWGIAVGTYDLDTHRLRIEKVSVINPVLPKGKQIRQNSLDLETAFQLYKGTIAEALTADAVFVEVPVGSQSARAMASYGICVGVLGAIRVHGIPFYEVTPTEVKLALYGKKDATKQQMIKRAVSNHPEANWPYYRENGVQLLSEAKAEHMADAIGAIHAGLHLQSFKQLLALRA